nr:PAS domain S-box protein [Roseomonas acroporae]
MHLEDSPLDAELAAAALARAGMHPKIERVETREAFVDTLARGGFDLILADHRLPTFDGLTALDIARREAPDVPFVFLSGTLGEETAIDAMRNGATDYVVKQRLTRLPVAVGRAVAERRERRERLAAEAALRESRARLDTLIAQAPVGIMQFDRDGRIVLVNEHFAAMLGRTPESLIGQPKTSITHPDDRAATEAALAGLAASGSSRRIEKRYLRADGRPVWAETLLSLTGGEGTPQYALAIVQDLTERRRAAAALRAAEATSRLALRAAGLGTWDYDLVSGSLTWDARCRALFGVPAAAPVDYDTTFLAGLHPDDRARVDAAVKQSIEAGKGSFDEEFRVLDAADGRERWLASKGHGTFEGGRCVRLLGVIMDITDRKRSEQQLRLLINELNHRVKNTLATVQSVAAQTLRNAESTTQAREDFEQRLMALARAHDVLTRENWEGARLHDVIAQALDPYRHMGVGAERLQVEGPELVLPPRIALALAMAFHELATNAAKYGALSAAEGQVRIVWTLRREGGQTHLRLRWIESGGPPVQPPRRRGFGSRLIERGLARDLGGAVRTEFALEGVRCSIDAPLAEGGGFDARSLPSSSAGGQEGEDEIHRLAG